MLCSPLIYKGINNLFIPSIAAVEANVTDTVNPSIVRFAKSPVLPVSAPEFLPGLILYSAVTVAAVAWKQFVQLVYNLKKHLKLNHMQLLL